MNSRYLGGLYMALAASIWGGVYVVSKIVLEKVPPLPLLWMRYLVASAALLLLLLASRYSWRIRWRNLITVFFIALIGYVLSILSQFQGTELSSAHMGAVVTSATPAFMAVFARVLLREHVTKRKALSVTLATVGVLLVIDVGKLSSSEARGGLILGLAALTWALMSVIVKLLPNNLSSLTVTTYAIVIATVLLTPSAIHQLNGVSLWGRLGEPAVWGGILYLGIIGTAGAFFLWNKGLQLVDASSGGIYFFFQPLVGTLLGWLVLGETVGLTFWIGTALIVFSVVLVLRE